jgi:hypothetical protein
MPVLKHYSKKTIRRIDTGRLPVEVLTDILIDLKAVAAGVAEEEHDLPSNKVGPNRLKALLPKIA